MISGIACIMSGDIASIDGRQGNNQCRQLKMLQWRRCQQIEVCKNEINTFQYQTPKLQAQLNDLGRFLQTIQIMTNLSREEEDNRCQSKRATSQNHSHIVILVQISSSPSLRFNVNLCCLARKTENRCDPATDQNNSFGVRLRLLQSKYFSSIFQEQMGSQGGATISGSE